MMRTINYILIAILVYGSCTSANDESKVVGLDKYQIKFRPAFHESSEITFTRQDSGGRVDFFIFKRNSGDEPIDTVHIVSQPISNLIYEELQRNIFFQAMQLRSSNWTGCCDGMPILYSVMQGGDTSVLFLRSPTKSTDSSGYLLTVRALNQIRKFVTDSVILKHFLDVESYIE